MEHSGSGQHREKPRAGGAGISSNWQRFTLGVGASRRGNLGANSNFTYYAAICTAWPCYESSRVSQNDVSAVCAVDHSVEGHCSHSGVRSRKFPIRNPLAFPFQPRSIQATTAFAEGTCHRVPVLGSRAPNPTRFAKFSLYLQRIALFPRSSDERRCALFSSHPCTSGHLDAIPASNIKFPAISHSAFEVNSALALGATPEDGVGSAVYADSALVTARALHNWDDCAR